MPLRPGMSHIWVLFGCLNVFLLSPRVSRGFPFVVYFSSSCGRSTYVGARIWVWVLDIPLCTSPSL
jgi:hypothetical protein